MNRKNRRNMELFSSLAFKISYISLSISPRNKQNKQARIKPFDLGLNCPFNSPNIVCHRMSMTAPCILCVLWLCAAKQEFICKCEAVHECLHCCAQRARPCLMCVTAGLGT